jgi:hypothetical protein
MNFRRHLGIDGIDFLIHAGITAMLMVIADSASTGPGSDGAIAGVVAVSLGLLAWRRSRALKRIGTDTGEVQFDRMNELENRVAELEIQQGRVLELEERLDFTERLLTQQRDAVRQLGGPRQEA